MGIKTDSNASEDFGSASDSDTKIRGVQYEGSAASNSTPPPDSPIEKKKGAATVAVNSEPVIDTLSSSDNQGESNAEQPGPSHIMLSNGIDDSNNGLRSNGSMSLSESLVNKRATENHRDNISEDSSNSAEDHALDSKGGTGEPEKIDQDRVKKLDSTENGFKFNDENDSAESDNIHGCLTESKLTVKVEESNESTLLDDELNGGCELMEVDAESEKALLDDDDSETQAKPTPACKSELEQSDEGSGLESVPTVSSLSEISGDDKSESVKPALVLPAIFDEKPVDKGEKIAVEVKPEPPEEETKNLVDTQFDDKCKSEPADQENKNLVDNESVDKCNSEPVEKENKNLVDAELVDKCSSVSVEKESKNLVDSEFDDKSKSEPVEEEILEIPKSVVKSDSTDDDLDIVEIVESSKNGKWPGKSLEISGNSATEHDIMLEKFWTLVQSKLNLGVDLVSPSPTQTNPAQAQRANLESQISISEALIKFLHREGMIQGLPDKVIQERLEMLIPEQCFLPPSRTVVVMGTEPQDPLARLHKITVESCKPEELAQLTQETDRRRIKFQCFPCPAMTELVHDIGHSLVLERAYSDMVSSSDKKQRSVEKAKKAAEKEKAKKEAKTSKDDRDYCPPPDHDDSSNCSTPQKEGAGNSPEKSTSEIKVDPRIQQMKTSLESLKEFNAPFKRKASLKCGGTKCSFRTDSVHTLFSHSITPHKPYNKWMCPICEFSTNHQDSYLEHQLEFHRVPCEFESPPGKYPCPLCPLDFQFKGQMDTHIKATCKHGFNLRKNQAPTEEDLLHINRLFWNLSPAQLAVIQQRMMAPRKAAELARNAKQQQQNQQFLARSATGSAIRPIAGGTPTSVPIVPQINTKGAPAPNVNVQSLVQSRNPSAVGVNGIPTSAFDHSNMASAAVAATLAATRQSLLAAAGGTGGRSSPLVRGRGRPPGSAHQQQSLSAFLSDVMANSGKLPGQSPAGGSEKAAGSLPSSGQQGGNNFLANNMAMLFGGKGGKQGAFAAGRSNSGGPIPATSSQTFRNIAPAPTSNGAQFSGIGNAAVPSSRNLNGALMSAAAGAVTGLGGVGATMAGGNMGLTCELCDGVLRNLSHMLEHFQVVHRKMLGKSIKDLKARPPLACSRCQSRHYTYEGLERHLLASHGLVSKDLLNLAQQKRDAGKCKICGKVYAFNLLHHVAVAHKIQLCSADIMYSCDICRATYSSYVLLEEHLAKHPHPSKQPPSGLPSSNLQGLNPYANHLNSAPASSITNKNSGLGGNRTRGVLGGDQDNNRSAKGLKLSALADRLAANKMSSSTSSSPSRGSPLPSSVGENKGHTPQPQGENNHLNQTTNNRNSPALSAQLEGRADPTRPQSRSSTHGVSGNSRSSSVLEIAGNLLQSQSQQQIRPATVSPSSSTNSNNSSSNLHQANGTSSSSGVDKSGSTPIESPAEQAKPPESRQAQASDKPKPRPSKVRYNCTPCGIRFTAYREVISHWEQKHLSKVVIKACRVESCEPCKRKFAGTPESPGLQLEPEWFGPEPKIPKFDPSTVVKVDIPEESAEPTKARSKNVCRRPTKRPRMEARESAATPSASGDDVGSEIICLD